MENVAAINVTPDELAALLQLIKRAPMTQAESLFIEMIFTRFQSEMRPQLLRAAAAAGSKPPGGAGAGDVPT